MAKKQSVAKKEGSNHRFKKFYADNTEKRRAYMRKWSKGRSTAYLKRHRELHPEKYKARVAVSNALRLGKITRPTACSNCAAPCKPTAHHADYSKPLVIAWLCGKCHMEVHGKQRHTLIEIGEAAT